MQAMRLGSTGRLAARAPLVQRRAVAVVAPKPSSMSVYQAPSCSFLGGAWLAGRVAAPAQGGLA
jgi:hypothetical protein